MTSKDYDHFHAEFNSVEAYERLCCRFLNNMQEVPFMINGEMLEILVGYEESREELVSSGLLMPAFLAKVNPKLVRTELQKQLSSEAGKVSILFASSCH